MQTCGFVAASTCVGLAQTTQRSRDSERIRENQRESHTKNTDTNNYKYTQPATYDTQKSNQKDMQTATIYRKRHTDTA